MFLFNLAIVGVAGIVFLAVVGLTYAGLFLVYYVFEHKGVYDKKEAKILWV